MSDDPPSPKRLKKDDHQENNSRSTMLILVGLPGSGKSTLASSLLRQSPRQWARINQDSINKGKRGTRDMCLKAAKLAIQQGYDVIIDRTSVTPEHRKYFIDLALAEGVDPSHIHCIFLNLPVKQCGARAAGRESHEGGLTGNGAYGIVGVMQKQLAAAGPPSVSEGFASLIECQNDDEINLALDLWVRHSTQIYNGEGEVLNLTAEWEKLKPKRKPSGGGGGLQSLDKFFIKKPTDKNTTNTRNAGGGDGAGPSSSAATKQVAASTGATTKNTENISNPSQPNKGENAFNILMAASKQQQHSSPSPAKKQPAATAGAPGTRHHFRAAAALYALQRYLNNPEQLLTNSTSTTDDNTVLYCDSQCVIIPDKFPKSRYHVLVLARNQRLQGPLDLTGADSALVRHMMDVGLKWAEDHAPASAKTCGFSVGFHSAPSMRQLHLHVISRDYDSPSLKNKKHWNSFTTPFFLDVDWVLDQLESMNNPNQQYLEYDVEAKEALLKEEMRCPKCRAMLPRMPDVKSHVAICTGKGEGRG